jgi:hypothetical protein
MLGALRSRVLRAPMGARMMSGHSMEHAIGALDDPPLPTPSITPEEAAAVLPNETGMAAPRAPIRHKITLGLRSVERSC